MRFSNKITIRTRHTISHKANDSRPCIVDTGTEEHLAKDESRLLQVEAIYLNHHDAPISIYAANEEELRISARGNIGDHVKHPAYISNDLGEHDLLSGPRLQQQVLWILMPPTNNHQNSIGCILAKSDGTIMGVTTKNLQIDPRDIYPRNIQMHMPVIPQAIKANALAISTNKKATTLKGVTLSRQDLVTFVHKIGHWSKREMKWMARLSDQGLGIDNFPLTEKEVDKYYPTECDCCPRGHHHRDPVRTKKVCF